MPTTATPISTTDARPKSNGSLQDQAQFSIERHEIIAGAAEQLIKPSTASAIAAIVSKLQPGTSLVDLAGWADQIKRRKPTPDDDADTVAFLNDPRNATQPTWHFVDIPANAAEYSRTALPEFTRDDDVVQMLGHAIKSLKGDSTRFSKLNALRLVVHLTGDVHQPVHVGCSFFDVSGAKPKLVLDPDKANGLDDDHGGNLIILPIGSKGTPLHSYWDSRLGGKVDVGDLVSDADFDAAAAAIEASADAEADVESAAPPAPSRDEVKRNAERLASMIRADRAAAAGASSDPTPPGPPEQWPVTWATASLQAAQSAYQGLVVVKLSGGKSKNVLVKFKSGRAEYDDRNGPILVARMKSAASNLAKLLDVILE